MLDEKKTAPRTHPSLLPLQTALNMAKSGSPSRPPRIDLNEQCAMRLIEMVKAEYKKQQFVLRWEDIPSPQGFHANLQATVHSNA